MSDNKTMIRFYTILFLMAALFTYLVDLNSQFYFIRLNSPFISNAFCFSILSGILTGNIVALAAELRQYLLHKRQARNTLYTLACELYALISVQRAGLRYYINNPNISIPQNIGGDYAQRPILALLFQFRTVDYDTFSKKDDIFLALQSFGTHIGMIEGSARNLATLQIAHMQTRTSFPEKNDSVSKVTAASSVMLNALHEEHEALKICLDEIDSFCAAFEKLDNCRYRWKESKETIANMGKKIEDDVHFKPAQK